MGICATAVKAQIPIMKTNLSKTIIKVKISTKSFFRLLLYRLRILVVERFVIVFRDRDN